MSESIAIHLDRTDAETIEVEPATLETDRSFEFVVTNHGEPVHVHIRANEPLADAIAIEESNPYVGAGETITVPVTVGAHEGPTSGSIAVETRFGANVGGLELTLTGGVGEERRVDVDERLGEPPKRDPDEGAPFDAVDRRLSPGTVGLVLLAGVALALGIGATFVVGGPIATVGLLVVLSGFAVAGYLLFGPELPV